MAVTKHKQLLALLLPNLPLVNNVLQVRCGPEPLYDNVLPGIVHIAGVTSTVFSHRRPMIRPRNL